MKKFEVYSLIVFITALLLRIINNFYQLQDPLYDFPLGGHSVYFNIATEIYNGNLIPFKESIHLNNPAFPYLLAFIYKIFGFENFLAVRLISLSLDSCTALLVYLIARRYSGTLTALLAGLFYATSGVVIFMANQLIAEPFAVFCMVLCVWLILAKDFSKFTAAGILAGLAIALRPNLMLLLPAMFFWFFFYYGLRRELAGFFIGAILALSPLLLVNYLSGGEVLQISSGSGHNFYIGHNAQAQAGYWVPAEMDGDIFLNYKAQAEEVEGSLLSDSKVSAYYYAKGLSWIIDNPVAELNLLLERLKLFFGVYELTTYGNYKYQQSFSALLAWLPNLLPVMMLSGFGLILSFRHIKDPFISLLLLLTLVSLLSVLGFFFISRLRITAVPWLCIFAALAGQYFLSLVRKFNFRKFILPFFFTGLWTLYIVRPAHIQYDSSNEWNKAGIILTLQNRYIEAEQALLEAQRVNPGNPNTRLNLINLYKRRRN